MSTPTSTVYPLNRAGKPVNIGDIVTVLATVTAAGSVSGSTPAGAQTTPTTSLTVTLLGSNQSVTVYANDVAASGQTL